MKLLGLLGFLLTTQFCVGDIYTGGILYPRNTESRTVLSLDGIWDFLVEDNFGDGHKEEWYKTGLASLKGTHNVEKMAVPASYNDISADSAVRDHSGLVWYEKEFYVPKDWQDNKLVWLRFGSVSYAAEVWINGELLMEHQIGHLPFVGDATDLVKFGAQNRITVACNNRLSDTSIPQGNIQTLENGRVKNTYSFDFFNYAGIDRPVYLYSTPKTYIDDIVLQTVIDGDKVTLNYEITTVGDGVAKTVVNLVDGDVVVNSNAEAQGSLVVDNPKLWWPYLMDPNPGFLYNFKVDIQDSDLKTIDSYNLRVGLRTVTWSDTQLLVNNKPVYLHGFGRHEDSDIRGKGLDYSLIVRDHNLIKWIGGNAYRTSHYPYAEEIMDIAEEYGIMIIDECPSVNTEKFTDDLKTNHKQSLTELIKRDKNRAAVIMWSAANEPRTEEEGAGDYFKDIIDHIKTLDVSRPTTIVEQYGPGVDSSKHVDIVSFNKYFAWYGGEGDIDVVTESIINLANSWHDEYKKPIINMEYGADTLEGLHFLPNYIWSEEYQIQIASKYFEGFDKLRASGFFIGEFIWNFADFKTAQTFTRVGGNKKGLFTRNRQPKSVAFHIRNRYWSLSQDLYNTTLPDDLTNYIISSNGANHDEL